MNKDDIYSRVEEAVAEATAKIRLMLPRDTGNLADRALTLTKTTNGYNLAIDDAIAPYVKYLVSEGSRTGKEYLHWEDAGETMASIIAAKLGETYE